MRNNTGTFRLVIINGIMVILFLILIGRMYKLQILNATENADKTELAVGKSVVLKSARGNIYDRNGKLLAYNRLAYSVIIKDIGGYRSNRIRQLSLNSVCYKLVKLFQKNGEVLNNELLIDIDSAGDYEYTAAGTRLERFKADLYGTAKTGDMTREQMEATAEELVNYMKSNTKFALYGERNTEYSTEELEAYGLKASYSKAETLAILGLRYMLSLNTYQKYMPVIAAKDVSEKTVIQVKENINEIMGADIEEDYKRVYDGGEAFAHILGYTGLISSEELEAYQEKSPDYTIRSEIGKTGMEQYMEDILKGRDGTAKLYVNGSGKVLKEGEVEEPVAGKDVYLSIDKDLQTAVYNILEQRIAGILVSNIINAKEFNKLNVRDASDIKIPIYEVYFALINNEVINLKDLTSETSSDFEKSIYKKLQKKKEEVLAQLRLEFKIGAGTRDKLTKEMQEYEDFITKNIKLWNEGAINKQDPMYLAWMNKQAVSTQEFFSYALKAGWINVNQFSFGKQYYTLEESCEALGEQITDLLKENGEFDKLLLKYLLKSDVISGTDICRLLYEQGILPKADQDYEALRKQEISPYTFIIKKIKNLEITPGQLALDPYSGSAVVVEARTGKILASVTYPGYDNNRLANQMDTDYYNKLYKDLSIPMYNRATQQLTAPGSTFKPVTVIAGLKEKVIQPDTSVFCNGIFDKVIPAMRCWKRSGHGNIENAAAALEHSCNDYLGEISYNLGMFGRSTYSDDQALKLIQDYAGLLDLDKKSGIELTESAPQVTDRYAIPSSIGQGTHNYTTVLLARYVNTLATKGTSYKLSLIDGVTDTATGDFIKKESELQSTVSLSEEIWDTVKQGMKQFAGSNSELKGIKIDTAGKSGTAQESALRPDHALFIGYAPTEKPEISVAVRIANGYASGNAVGTGKDILNYYFGLEKKEDIINGKATGAVNVRTD